MAANTTKTKTVFITTMQKSATLKEDQIQVVMFRELLTDVESDKLLGAIINKHLSWEEHIAKIVATVNKKLRRIKSYLRPSHTESSTGGRPLITKIFTDHLQPSVTIGDHGHKKKMLQSHSFCSATGCTTGCRLKFSVTASKS